MRSTLKDRFVKNLYRATSYILLIGVGILMIFPVIMLLVSSFKLKTEYLAHPFHFFPRVIQWGNYAQVFTLTPFLEVALRTALLGICVAILTTISSSMNGYAFARFQDVKASKILFRVVIVLMVVPGIVLVLPQFMLYSYLHLTNTYWPWILEALAGNSFFIFLYRQFFLGFPRELEEAAEIDGCGPFRVYWQILMPNSRPVIATILIFAFNGIWGDYLSPLIYLSDSKTLIGVTMAKAFVDLKGFPLTTVSFAATVIYILPLIVLFLFGQKHILKGMITSGLKG